MRAVLKYPLRSGDYGSWSTHVDGSRERDLEVRKGSRFLCVKDQYDEPVLYVVSEMEETAVERWTILEMATGERSSDLHRYDLRYLGTVMLHGGTLVLHYFLTMVDSSVSYHDQLETRGDLSRLS